MTNIIYSVYVKTDSLKAITAIESDVFLESLQDWTKIDQGQDIMKYKHASCNYFDKPIYTTDGIPRYKLVDGKVVERTSEELEKDKPQSVSIPPTIQQLSTEITTLKEQIDSIFDVLTTLAHNM